jgi:hypothetical protein
MHIHISKNDNSVTDSDVFIHMYAILFFVETEKTYIKFKYISVIVSEVI